VVIDPCVLTSPCWLAEHLAEAGVAETDWTREIPVPVIDVVEAMYTRLDREWYPTEDALEAVAAHFRAARDAHRDAVVRYQDLDGDPFPP
jgi:hypothetical protein